MQTDAQAARLSDAQNGSTSYIIRKVHSKRGSLMRRNFVLSIMCDKGMPAAIMVTPIKEFNAWMRVRTLTEAELKQLQKDVAAAKVVWPFKMMPREIRAKVIASSKISSFMYVETAQLNPKNPACLQITFVPESDGTLRSTKEFEFRPEPYSKAEAAAKCAEATEVVQCGMMSSFMQKPMLVDRSLKPVDIAFWCEQVKPHVNARNAYGKTNVHHQIQLQQFDQKTKVSTLLGWRADPNAEYGPTKMTPLHMAASWHKPEVVEALIKAGADPTRVDVNGLGPLHCAAIYGDVASVRALVATGKVDVNHQIDTVRGEMTPLDCALECEESEETVLELWEFLTKHGADTRTMQDFNVYPEPYPPLRASRLVGLIAMATCNRWQTRVDREGRLITDYVGGKEEPEEIRKLSIMLQAGMNANEPDIYGRTPIATCTAPEVVELLLRFNADPGDGEDPDAGGALRFAKEYVKVHYLGTIADKTDQLREVKKAKTLAPLAETAEAMAKVVATARLELQLAFTRALCSTVPLFEALAEGKLEKAERLLDAGATPFLRLSAVADTLVDFSSVLPEGSQQYKRFERAFGSYIWKEHAMKMMRFSDTTMQVTAVYGSQLLQAKHARTEAFRGLNLPDHKLQSERYTMLLERIQAAEEMEIGTIPPSLPNEPSAEDVADQTRTTHRQLQILESNPAAKLLEEAVAATRPGAELGGGMADAFRDVPTKRQSMAQSRIGSEYFEYLQIDDGTGGGADGAAGGSGGELSDSQSARQVSQYDKAVRESRRASRMSGISLGEGWGAYRERTMSVHLDSDDEFDDGFE